MGGGNWLRDDSAVNGGCHVIKWIHTALFIMLGLRHWPVGGRGGSYIQIHTDVKTHTNTHTIWADWSLETHLLSGALWPELELASYTSSPFCVCVCVCNSTSVLLQWLSSWQGSALSKSESTILRYHLSNIHLLFLDSWVHFYFSLCLCLWPDSGWNYCVRSEDNIALAHGEWADLLVQNSTQRIDGKRHRKKGKWSTCSSAAIFMI